MTPQQVEDFTKDLSETIKAGLDITMAFVPMGATWLLLGKAIATAMPSMAKTVNSWVEGNPPTQEELDEFKRQLAVLSDPNAP